MNTAPTLSVVIPCYNASAFLLETIDSILRQTERPAEIILVDDGSTDDSAAIAESFGAAVRVIRQPNQGESVARNRGIDEARGEWVALLDADDRWEPDKLEKQIAVLRQADDDIACVYTDFYHFRDDERLDVVTRTEYHLRDDYRAYMLCLSDATILTSSALVRTDFAGAVRFPEETKFSEDMIFFARLRDFGRFVRIAEPLTGYRITGSNQSRGRGFILQSVKARYEWFLNNNELFVNGEQETVRELLTARLVEGHDMAFWDRDHTVVRQCREFFAELSPTDMKKPSSFDWPLYPRLLLQLKDQLDYLIKPRAKQ